MLDPVCVTRDIVDVRRGIGVEDVPELYGPGGGPLRGDFFGRVHGGYWRKVSGTMSLRHTGARPRPENDADFHPDHHGLDLRCDRGGWFYLDDIVRELQRAQKRLHGQWPIDRSVVYHSVMANPKRRFQLAFAYVTSANSTGEWVVPPGAPDVKWHGCPLSFLHSQTL